MQNVIQGLAGLVFLAISPCRGSTDASASPHVPLVVSLVGDAMIAVGFLIVFLTFRENTFTAGTIDRRGPTRHRRWPLRHRTPPNVRGRARHHRRRPPGAWLMVGLDPRLPCSCRSSRGWQILETKVLPSSLFRNTPRGPEDWPWCCGYRKVMARKS